MSTHAKKDDKQSTIVAVNMVNNIICTLNNTITTQFHDKLTIVTEATDQLYHILGLKTEHIMELGKYFVQNEAKVSVFLALPEKEHKDYAFNFYRLCVDLSTSL